MSLNFEQHCQEESLELYALGRLDEPSTELLEEHILICEGCRTRLDQADRYVLAMRSAAQQFVPVPQPASLWVRLQDLFRIPAPAWAAVGVALCAVIMVSTALTNRQRFDDRPEVVSLHALRNEQFAVAPAHRALDLTLDTTGLAIGDARLNVVDAEGTTVEIMDATSTAGKLEIHTRKSFNPGLYYIRLYAPGGTEELREFGLRLK